MIDGIINIYKEQDFTSRDAVSKLCGIIHQKKAGHTGTLDPMAEGVLPVCLGKATKLVNMFVDHDKQYRTVIKLGQATDTEDVTGKVTLSSYYDDEWYDEIFDSGRFDEAVHSFIGDYNQIPPMYSAKKINGKKLYEIARSGQVIERKPCLVHINDITVNSINRVSREAVLTVSCGKGTYIRTLCHDIGEKLGCYACMKELVRTKVGRFDIKEAYRLSEVSLAVAAGELDKLIIPIEDIFKNLRAVKALNEGEDKLLRNGGQLRFKKEMIIRGEKTDPADDELFAMYDLQGKFTAVYSMDNAKGFLKVKQMFVL